MTQNAEGSRNASGRESSDETGKPPPSAQQVQSNANTNIDTETEDGEEDSDSDPSERIANFDWDGLHERYHDAINKSKDDEAELLQEWSNLMNVLPERYPGLCVSD